MQMTVKDKRREDFLRIAKIAIEESTKTRSMCNKAIMDLESEISNYVVLYGDTKLVDILLKSKNHLRKAHMQIGKSINALLVEYDDQYKKANHEKVNKILESLDAEEEK
jgi:hypothetical protein|nr:MAG TPA: hypothetical protein [Caudoviricetes sp.]